MLQAIGLTSAPRRDNPRRGRPDLRSPAGPCHRVARCSWVRQVHRSPSDARTPSGAGCHLLQGPTAASHRSSRPRGWGAARRRTGEPGAHCTRAAPHALCRSRLFPPPAQTNCSRWSGSRDWAISASALCRRAWTGGSALPRRCSATRTPLCSMSRPRASRHVKGAGFTGCCVRTRPKGARCCTRRVIPRRPPAPPIA